MVCALWLKTNNSLSYLIIYNTQQIVLVEPKCEIFKTLHFTAEKRYKKLFTHLWFYIKYICIWSNFEFQMIGKSVMCAAVCQGWAWSLQ